MSEPFNVLFLCTGNSARSILAEVQLGAIGEGKFKAYSAGSHPKGEINPYTLEWLRKQGLPTAGLRSKSWEEFTGPAAPTLHFVFTVCDQAAGEMCPYWPGQPVTAHWGVSDPAAVDGSEQDKQRAFRDAATALRRRIELFANLPLTKLDALSLKQRLDQIGKST